MRRRDFIAGSGALLLTGLPQVSLAKVADKGGLLAAQARLNATLVGHLQGARGKGENIVVSPASLTAILAVLAQGADPRMQAAIHKCLGLDGAPDAASGDLQALRSQLRNVGLAREEQGATFTLANLIVIDPASQPNAPVVAKLRDGAEVVIDDLSKLATVNQINAWVSGQTKGFIRKVFDGPQRATGLAGVNALYFKGLWKDRFDAKLTQARPFHLVGGGTSDVPLMMRIGSYRHRQDGRFVAVDLPYRNERFGLVVATTSDTPATAAEFSHVGDWLTGEEFNSGPGRSLAAALHHDRRRRHSGGARCGRPEGRPPVADLVRAAVFGSADAVADCATDLSAGGRGRHRSGGHHGDHHEPDVDAEPDREDRGRQAVCVRASRPAERAHSAVRLCRAHSRQVGGKLSGLPNLAVIPGRREAAGPESSSCPVWIPGSRLSARPGMTRCARQRAERSSCQSRIAMLGGAGARVPRRVIASPVSSSSKANRPDPPRVAPATVSFRSSILSKEGGDMPGRAGVERTSTL